MARRPAADANGHISDAVEPSHAKRRAPLASRVEALRRDAQMKDAGRRSKSRAKKNTRGKHFEGWSLPNVSHVAAATATDGRSTAPSRSAGPRVKLRAAC
ncbi:unnamed protein product [Lampetra fluviatilis]